MSVCGGAVAANERLISVSGMTCQFHDSSGNTLNPPNQEVHIFDEWRVRHSSQPIISRETGLNLLRVFLSSESGKKDPLRPRT
jgi:hypothetical protein